MNFDNDVTILSAKTQTDRYRSVRFPRTTLIFLSINNVWYMVPILKIQL